MPMEHDSEDPDSLGDSPPEHLSQEGADQGGGPPAGEPFRGSKPRPATPERGWSDLPSPLMVKPAPPKDYPAHLFSPDLLSVIEATQRLAECPAAIVGTFLLGSLALLAQDDVLVETLAPHLAPASLFTVTLAASGLHKSTAAKLLGQGHQEADEQLAARWAVAKKLAAGHGAAGQDGGQESEERARPPRPSNPKALFTDFTTDATLNKLEGGRPSVALWSHEVGIQLHLSLGKSQGQRTMSFLSLVWDGDMISKIRADEDASVYLSAGAYAVSLVWAGQPDVVAPILFGALAENGFLARSLVCRCDESCDPGDPLEGDFVVVRRFNDKVLRVRERQDRGVEYAQTADEPGRVKRVIELAPGARDVLRTFHRAQRSLAAALRSNGQQPPGQLRRKSSGACGTDSCGLHGVGGLRGGRNDAGDGLH